MIEQPNLSYIDELAGDDEGFRGQFIDVVKSEFPLEKDEYFGHIDNSRFKETAEIVHKLKHKFNILGMHDSYKLAVTYEMELLEGKYESKTKFDNVLATIEEYIKTI
ncbi:MULTISPECIES: Hpt domain-containing protein [Maribacter]|uniref:Hpt domain-containing protein n=1 Tax=Maribacter TaxID=252356 RepID=UPI0023EA8FE6|nr:MULTISPECIES: Hpt domain-containing protein [Maribacter]MDF4221825.1 Hpt domain-containing protein [Maribacter huludaoensis]